MIFFPGRIDKTGDSRLLELYIRTGKMEYFGELYNRYTPLIYGVCLKYLKNTEAAEDAVMQIFEDTAMKISRYEVREFRVWIYSVARNHCLQELRKKKVEITVEEFQGGIVESDEVLHLLIEGGGEQRLEALRKCLEQLPEPQKVSITLFFMEEKSYADIADITEYNVKSVKSYIQNGKRNLKICIEKQQAGE